MIWWIALHQSGAEDHIAMVRLKDSQRRRVEQESVIFQNEPAFRGQKKRPDYALKSLRIKPARSRTVVNTQEFGILNLRVSSSVFQCSLHCLPASWQSRGCEMFKNIQYHDSQVESWKE